MERGVVGIAGVVELWTVGDQHEHVHLRAHFDVLAAGGDAIFESQSPCGSDGNVHEEVDVAGEIALLERKTRVREREQEVVAARVHVLGVIAVANGVALRGARAAQRVVTATSVRDDRQHRRAQRRAQHRARRQIQAALMTDRIRRAVAFAEIRRAVEQRVDRLVAFQVYDAQGLPARDAFDETLTGWHHAVSHGTFRIEAALLQGSAGHVSRLKTAVRC